MRSEKHGTMCHEFALVQVSTLKAESAWLPLLAVEAQIRDREDAKGAKAEDGRWKRRMVETGAAIHRNAGGRFL